MATRSNGGTGVRRKRNNDRPRSAGGPPVVNLALQGGGSHGAFTWGVLDALLEDGRLGFEGISGELRAIAFVERLLRENKLDPGRYKRINMHMIDAEEQLSRYGASSKSYTSPGFLKELFDLGRRTAADWLDRNFAYVGHVSSVRIAERFL